MEIGSSAPPSGTRSASHRRGVPHEFVNGIIMLPNSGQAHATLDCDTKSCCLRARSAFERRIPQPPSPPGFGADRAQQVLRTVQSPNALRAGASRPDLFSCDGRMETCSSCRTRDGRERGAEEGARLLDRAALHQHRDAVDAVALERLQRHAPGIGLAGPIAELDPAAQHVVVGDRAALVLAALDRDRDRLGEIRRARPRALPRGGGVPSGALTLDAAVGERERHRQRQRRRCSGGFA